MAKNKKTTVSYDKDALNAMANTIKSLWRPVEKGVVPELEIDLLALEVTVKNLHKKEREKLEKFWGLIPGTIRRDKIPEVKRISDVSLGNLEWEARKILYRMTSIEYLYMFERNARELVNNFSSKINKEGYEELSDIDALKYIMILFAFFAGGPQMTYDNEMSEIDAVNERKIRVDNYVTLNAFWKSTGHNLSDHSINLRLFINILEMFDIKDVITMKRFVGLYTPKEYSDMETESLECLWNVRKFKERVFKDGGWEVSMVLVYNPSTIKEEVEKFKKMLEEKSVWQLVLESKTLKQKIKTSEGEKEIKIYKIAGLEFSDTYELEVLSLCGNDY